MLPTLEDYRSGCTTWTGTVEVISYSVKHWGVSDYQRYGIWNYYLHINEQLFQNPADFEQFWLPRKLKEFGESQYASYDYYIDPITALDFHAGPTFYEPSTFFDRNTGKDYRTVKVGCDYSHLWDQEAGYPDTLASVRADAERSCRLLFEAYPHNRRCAYSGIVDHPNNFFETNAGWWVHNSKEEAAGGHSNWQRKVT